MGKRDEPEAFVYGLIDPRIDDFVTSLRYVGQTRVGLDRPKSHFRADSALESDKNLHKANWIRQIRKLGLVPDIVVLERVVETTLGVDDLRLRLNDVERRLIAFYREAGSPLLNIQEGGSSGYVLSDAERQKISDANGWVPKAKTIEGIDSRVILGPWSREKAWWLGLTFARSQVEIEPGSRDVVMRTGNVELAEKWRNLAGARSKRIHWRQRDWEVSLGDVRVAKWLSEQYRLQDRWSSGLDWPSDLPAEFSQDFVRGIWDVRAHIEFKPRPDRQPMMRTSVESASWSDGFRRTLAGLIIGSKIFNGGSASRLSSGVAVRGSAVVPFLETMYLDAPDDLCMSGQRSRALDACAKWKLMLKECRLCGEQAAVGKDLCNRCSRKKWVGASCRCGSSQIVAKGLCSSCYQKEWGKKRQSWVSDEGLIRRLDAFDVPGWIASPVEEKDRQLEWLVSEFLSKGFPWFVIEDVEAEGVLGKVSSGKVTFEGLEVRNVSGVGQSLCLKANPHRLNASYRNNPSAVDAFSNEKFLRKAIRFQLQHGDPVTPKRVLRAVLALQKVPTNFPPALARWVVDRYAIDCAIVLDPCAGYGGRLLGCLASPRMAKYVGFDIEPKTVRGNQELARMIGGGARSSVEAQAVEEGVWPTSDLVFTGPPYFDRENYGESSSARLTEHGSWDGWLGGFMAVLLRKAAESSPVTVLNVGSFRMGSEQMDLPGETIRLASEVGLKLREQLDWKLASFGKSSRQEKLLVFDRA